MADSEAEFEGNLRKDLPRGLKGQEDNLPRTRWAGPSPILQVATPTPDAQGSVRPVNILLGSCEVTV